MPQAEGGYAHSAAGYTHHLPAPARPPLSLRDISPRWGEKISRALRLRT